MPYNPQSNLLLDEYPLMVLPTLAVKLGLNAAIVIQQIHYWLKVNERMGRKKAETHFYEGRWWTYNTYTEWQESNFPWWSNKTIRRAFAELRERGLIECRDKGSEGLWVTIVYEELYRACEMSGQNDQPSQEGGGQADQGEVVKMTGRGGQNGSDNAHTETSPETTTESLNGGQAAVGGSPAAMSQKERDEFRRLAFGSQANESKESPKGKKGIPDSEILDHDLTRLFMRETGVQHLTKDMRDTLINPHKLYTEDGIFLIPNGLIGLWDSVPGFDEFCRQRIPELLAMREVNIKPPDILKHLRNLDKPDGKVGFWLWREANPSLCRKIEDEPATPIDTSYTDDLMSELWGD